MPRGKVHGQGGHGRHSREMLRGYEHREVVSSIIERKQQKSQRRQDRNISELMHNVQTEMIPKVKATIERILADMKRKVGTSNINIMKIIAINNWYIAEIEKELFRKRLITEALSVEEREQLSLIAEADYQKHMEHLLGKNPSALRVREVKEQLEKWQQRVPKILKGEY
jgi:hypothetical protein